MRLFVERVQADQAAQINPAPADAGRLPNGSVLVRQGESIVFRLRLDRQRHSSHNAPIPSHREQSLRYVVPPAAVLDRTHGFRVTLESGRVTPGTRHVGLEDAIRMSDGSFVRLDLPRITFSESGPLQLLFTARIPSEQDWRRMHLAQSNRRRTRGLPHGAGYNFPHGGLRDVSHLWLHFSERYEVVSETEWARRRESALHTSGRYYNRTNDPHPGIRALPRTTDRNGIERHASRGMQLLGDSAAETTASLDPYLVYDRLNQSLIALNQMRREIRLSRGRAALRHGIAVAGARAPFPTQPEATGEEIREASRGTLELLVGLIPVIGDVLGVVEAVMGRELFTDEGLSLPERGVIGGLSAIGLLTLMGGVMSRLAGVLSRGRVIRALARRVGWSQARAFRAAAVALGDADAFERFQRLVRRVGRGAALSNAERDVVLSYLRRLEDLLIAGHTGRLRDSTDRVAQSAFDGASRHVSPEDIARAGPRSAASAPIRIPGLDLEFRFVTRDGRRYLAVCS